MNGYIICGRCGRHFNSIEAAREHGEGPCKDTPCDEPMSWKQAPKTKLTPAEWDEILLALGQVFTKDWEKIIGGETMATPPPLIEVHGIDEESQYQDYVDEFALNTFPKKNQSNKILKIIVNTLAVIMIITVLAFLGWLIF